MQLFFRIKEDGFLDASDDPEVKKQAKKHKDRFRELLKKFGWSNAKKEKDINVKDDVIDPEDPSYLDPNSPYKVLSEVYGIRNMVTIRNEKRVERISKDLANYFSNTEEKDIQQSKLDASSDIYSLYLESEEINKQAKSDVNDVPALNKRKEEIEKGLDKAPYLKNYYPVINDIIMKSIALGYTAGINANVTEALRRSNSSNNSSKN